MRYAKLFLISILFLAFGCQPKTEEMQRIHIEDFFSVSTDKQWDISPDGKYLSSIERKDFLSYFCLETADSTLSAISKFVIKKNIEEYYWINPHEILYLSSCNSDSIYQISILNLTTKQSKLYYTSDKKVKLIRPNEASVREVAVLLPSSTHSSLWDAYRINFESDTIALDMKNPGGVIEWVYDAKLQLRAAKAIAADKNKMEIWYRQNNQAAFEPILNYGFEDEIREICFTNDGENLNLLSNIGSDKIAWIEYNPKTKKEAAQWYKNDEVDLEHFIRFAYNSEVAGVSYIECTEEKYIKSDKLEKITQSINLFFGHSQWEYVNASEKSDKFLIFSSSDIEVGSYYLYNNAQGKCIKIFQMAKWLQKADLNPQHCLSIPLNQNTNIQAYISFPRAYTKMNAKDLPLLVYIHDGPHLRDKNKYQADIQFFTNRGYAVLQVNYRASSGYGKAYKTAADQQWHKIPTQDVKAAINYVIKQSWVNGQRVGLMGSGFASFVAQKCIEKYPNQFACAILDTAKTNYQETVLKAMEYSDSLGSYMQKKIGHFNTDTSASAIKSDSIFWDNQKITKSIDSIVPVLKWKHPQKQESKESILNMYLEIDTFLDAHIGSNFKVRKQNRKS